MILTGKDLFNYRMKKIKKFGFMFVSILAFVSVLMLMCIAYG